MGSGWGAVPARQRRAGRCLARRTLSWWAPLGDSTASAQACASKPTGC